MAILTDDPAARRRSRFWVALLLAAIAVVAGAAIWTNLARERARAADGLGTPNENGLETLEIRSGGQTNLFQVEVMRDEAGRARGLMERKYLPADRGMLFDFRTEQPVTFWMKNTYIPLDMIFIRKDGTIARIADRAEPLSERTIDSGGPVVGVLEVNGGVAEKLGIKAGDKVRHAMFGR